MSNPSRGEKNRQADIRVSEFASSVGAGILGLGLGAWLGASLQKVFPLIIAIGLAMHSWGMFTKHRLESRAGVFIPGWSKAFYWLCWLGIAGIILKLFL